MQNLTSKVDGLSSGDISSSIDILDKIVTITNRTGEGIEKEVHSILPILIIYSVL